MPSHNIEHTKLSPVMVELCSRKTRELIANYKKIYEIEELELTFAEVLEPGLSKYNMIIGSFTITLQWNSVSLIILFFQYF